MERIGDFSSPEVKVDLHPRFDLPYDLVLSVPGKADVPPPFHGVLEMTADDGTTSSINLDSSMTAHCDWITDPSLSSFVLGWGRRLQLTRLLHRDQTTHLHFTFDVPPPAGCSLWFSSVERKSPWSDLFSRLMEKPKSSGSNSTPVALPLGEAERSPVPSSI